MNKMGLIFALKIMIMLMNVAVFLLNSL